MSAVWRRLLVTPSSLSRPTPNTTTSLLAITRPFSPALHRRTIHLPPRITLNDADITESFLKGSGPGGQKINKTASAVQLKHLPTGIVVKCQATRSRSQNRKIARQLLADKVEDASKRSDSTNTTGGGVGAGAGKSRLALKSEAARAKKASRTKKAKRKYRRLDAERAEQQAVRHDDDDDDDSNQDEAGAVSVESLHDLAESRA